MSEKLLQQGVTIHRATPLEIDATWKILREYYKVASVIAQDSRNELERIYYRDGSGVWLAIVPESGVVGCIALRPLAAMASSAEVKRLYVHTAFRGRGTAGRLYAALERYAIRSGYQWLYLDTANEMVAAQSFYRSLGYRPCARYNDNP